MAPSTFPSSAPASSFIPAILSSPTTTALWWCRARLAEDVLRKSEARERKEEGTRARLQAGELGLDIYGMREKLAEKG